MLKQTNYVIKTSLLDTIKSTNYKYILIINISLYVGL
jgi:hypothetical protein